MAQPLDHQHLNSHRPGLLKLLVGVMTSFRMFEKYSCLALNPDLSNKEESLGVCTSKTL